jgi:hypothetical protein
VQKVVVYGEEAFDPAALTVERVGPNGGNGNGNGTGAREQRTGNGGHAPEAQGPARPGVSSQIRIVLEETDDPDEDHERLRALVNALNDYSGEGEVRLAIKQRDGAEVEMELPRARYCPELTQLLGDIVGPWGFVGA